MEGRFKQRQVNNTTTVSGVNELEAANVDKHQHTNTRRGLSFPLALCSFFAVYAAAAAVLVHGPQSGTALSRHTSFGVSASSADNYIPRPRRSWVGSSVCTEPLTADGPRRCHSHLAVCPLKKSFVPVSKS